MTARGPLIDGTTTPEASDVAPDPGVLDADRPIPTREGGFDQGMPVELGGGGLKASADIQFPSPPPITPGVDALTGNPPVPPPISPDFGALARESNDRSNIWQALYMHLGPTMGILEPSSVKPIADLFYNMVRDDPALLGMLNDDVRTLNALTDEELRAHLASGQPLTTFSAVLESLADVFFEVGAVGAWERAMQNDRDTLRSSWQQLTEADLTGLRDRVDEIRRERPMPIGSPEAQFAAQFTNGLKEGGPGTWVWDGNRGLLVKATDRQGTEFTWIVNLEAGTRIENTAEALVAVLDATQGVSHDMVQAPDAQMQPHPLAWVNDLWRKSMGLMGGNPEQSYLYDFGGVRGIERVSLAELEGADRAKAIDQAVEDAQLPADAWIGMLAAHMRTNAVPASINAAGALSMARQVFFDEKETIITEVENMTRQEAVEAFTAELDERPVAQRKLDQVMSSALDKFQWWDAFTQAFAIEAQEIIAGVPVSLAGGELAGKKGEELLDQAWSVDTDLPTSVGGAGREHDRVSEFYGMEPGSTEADLVDFTSSVVFDPFNIIFGGGKWSGKLLANIMTKPEYAKLVRSLPLVKSTAKVIASDDIARATRTAIGFSEGLDDAAHVALADIALDPTASPQQVLDLFESSMASTPGPGHWLPPGMFGRTTRRDTWAGAPKLLDRLNVLPESQKRRVYQVFANLSKNRTIPLNESTFIDRLLNDIVVAFWPEDPEKQVFWWKEAVGVVKNQRSYADRLQTHTMRIQDLTDKGTGIDEQITVLEQELTQAATNGDQINSILQGTDPSGTTMSKMLSDLAGEGVMSREDITRFADELANLMGEPIPGQEFVDIGSAPSLGSLDDLLPGVDDATKNKVWLDMNQVFDDIGESINARLPEVNALRARKQSVTSEIDKAERGWRAQGAAERRQPLAELVDRIYTEKARELGAFDQFDAVIYGDDVLAALDENTRRALLQTFWQDEVGDMLGQRGRSGLAAAEGEFVPDPFQALGLGEEIGDSLRTAGFFGRRATVGLPVSPAEVVLYERLKSSPAVLKAARAGVRKLHATAAIAAMKRLWGANLLLNLVSSTKGSIDEILTFLSHTGRWNESVRASLAGIGAMFTGEGRALRMFAKGALDNAYSGFMRRNLDLRPGVEGFEWLASPLKRKGRGRFLDAAERFVNGRFLRDEGLQMWALATKAGDKQVFLDWWNEIGSRKATANVINDVNGNQVPLTGDTAHDLIQDSIELWSTILDPAYEHAFMARLLDGLTGGKPFSRTKDAKLLLAMREVPASKATRSPGNPLDFAWKRMWGDPAKARGAVMFDFFYRYYNDLYREAFTNKGMLLTPDVVAKQAGITRKEAAARLARSEDDVMIDLVGAQGGATETMVDEWAAAKAQQQTDDLMYRVTATSIIGETTENFVIGFPFARAQMDFLYRWWKRMTAPPVVRAGPRARATPVLGQAINLVESLPINARLASRYTHLLAQMNDDQDPSAFDEAVEGWTFIPTRMSGEFLIDVLPSPSPVPSWLIDWQLQGDDNKVREVLETMWPALVYTPPGASVTDFADYLFPDSRRSLRSLFGGMFRLGVGAGIWESAGPHGQQDPGEAALAWMTGAETFPAGAMDGFKMELGTALENMRTDVIPGMDDWNTTVNTLIDKAVASSSSEEGWSLMYAKINPGNTYIENENKSLAQFEALIAEQQLLTELGVWDSDDLRLVDPATGEPSPDGIPETQYLWNRYQEGSLDPQERQGLANRFYGMLFDRTGDIELTSGLTLRDYLVFKHPGLAVNMVATTAPTTRAEGTEFGTRYTNNGRLVGIPPGVEGRQVREEAWEDGLLTWRSPREVAYDAHSIVWRATGKVIRAAYRAMVGREWGADSTYRANSETGELESGVAKFLRNAPVDVSSPDNVGARKLLEEAGVKLPDGVLSVQQLREVIEPVIKASSFEDEHFSSLLDRGGMAAKLSLHADPHGAGLVQAIREMDSKANAEMGLDQVQDWPEEWKEAVRETVRGAVDRGYVTADEYHRFWSPMFGDLNYEPPVPPPVSEIETGVRVNAQDIASGAVRVIDGDTLAMPMADGELLVRLIGINAPESNQEGYLEARNGLRKVIENANEVVLAQWDPQKFGATTGQRSDGTQRVLLWLYIDGVPIYDPTVFSSSDPRGGSVGGQVLDYARIAAGG